MEEKDIHKEHRKRLRERFDKDPGGFTKHELLELLLFYAIPRRNVNPVAHKLLAKYGSVKNVLRADGKDLAEVDGIGESAATYLNLIGKLLDVVADEKQDETKIYRFDDIKIYLLNLFKAATAEQFCAIYLSKNERILFKEVYTDNDKNGVSVDMIRFRDRFPTLSLTQSLSRTITRRGIPPRQFATTPPPKNSQCSSRSTTFAFTIILSWARRTFSVIAWTGGSTKSSGRQTFASRDFDFYL